MPAKDTNRNVFGLSVAGAIAVGGAAAAYLYYRSRQVHGTWEDRVARSADAMVQQSSQSSPPPAEPRSDGRDRSMTMSQHVLFDANAPTKSMVFESKEPPQTLLEGQVDVRVAKLVVTANTVTYALAGNHPELKYFQHFAVPKDAPQNTAMTPCWGTGVVARSRCPGVAVGTRLHGYFPFSPSVVLTPSKVKATTFVDAAPRRLGLFEAYRTYYSHEDPMYKGLSADAEDWQMATGVLFSTGWAMAQVAAVHPAKPTALIVTSASSRTARACAFAAKHHNLALQLIGLTSQGNVDYVRGLGLYDIVKVYGEEASLPKQKVAVQDVAGSAKIQESLYKHFGDDIVHFSCVGISHAGTAGQKPKLKGLGGVRPSPFFVITAIDELTKVMGKQECTRQLIGASQAYRTAMMSEFKAERCFGGDATRAVFNKLVAGQGNAQVTYVCSLWPENQRHELAASKL